MLQNQLANWGDKMFEKDMASIVSNHSLWGAIILALPLFGLEWIVFVCILWDMYGDLCKKCGRKFTFGSLTVGIVVNIIVAFIIDALLTFIPVIGWLGTSFIVYLQFYSSGKGFIETLRGMDIGRR